MFFTHKQLIERDYDPVAAGLVDLADLRRRYEGYVSLDQAAAIWGILVKECGRLHDEIARAHGHERPLARHRNQWGMLPRVKFEDGSDIYQALEMLLEETPIREDDLVNVGRRGTVLCCLRCSSVPPNPSLDQI